MVQPKRISTISWFNHKIQAMAQPLKRQRDTTIRSIIISIQKAQTWFNHAHAECKLTFRSSLIIAIDSIRHRWFVLFRWIELFPLFASFIVDEIDLR